MQLKPGRSMLVFLAGITDIQLAIEAFGQLSNTEIGIIHSLIEIEQQVKALSEPTNGRRKV